MGVTQPENGLLLRRIWQKNILPPLITLSCVGVITAILLLIDPSFTINIVPIAYLIPVVVAATQWGIWPATLASIAGTAAADFFFFPPIYSLEISDPQEQVDLLLFLVVALVSSNLASRLRQETEKLRQQEQEVQRLYEFSRRLAACFNVSDLISAIQNYLSHTLEHQAAFFGNMNTGDSDSAFSGSSVIPEMVRENAAQMIASIGFSSRTVVEEPAQNIWLLSAICSEAAVYGVVAINIGSGPRETIKIRKARVEDVLEEVSLTLQRLDLGQAMKEAELHLQAQLLRDAFHGTLSHELVSPLAAIQGSTAVLGSLPEIQGDDRIRSLVDAISDEVAELDGFIRNLLNATRVTASGVSPQLEWVDPRDIVNAAIKSRARRLAAHQLDIQFDEDLPLINVDSGLVEESLGQILENAAKYSPAGSTISMETQSVNSRVILLISDQGVGIMPDDQKQMGLRSFRSQRHRATLPGSGLGFWIASTFVKANGGNIEISSRGRGKGTTVSISFSGHRMTNSELTTLSHE